jgi:hypothetical protein
MSRARRFLPLFVTAILALGLTGARSSAQLRAAPVDTDPVLKPRPAALDTATRLKRISQVAGITATVVGDPVSFSPRQLYVGPGVDAGVRYGNVFGGANVAHLFHRSDPSKAPGTVQMRVKPMAGKPYVADCTVDAMGTPNAQFEMTLSSQGSAPTKLTATEADGHVFFVVPKSTSTSVAIDLRRANYDAQFTWYGCDFVSVGN